MFTPTFSRPVKQLTTGSLLLCLGVLPQTGLGQAEDSAFLACAEHSERDRRLACLEETLDKALNTFPADRTADDAAIADAAPALPPSDDKDEPDARSETLPLPSSRPTSLPTEPAVVADEALERFGRSRAQLLEDEAGEQSLQDTVVELRLLKANQWRVTLSSGQVWHQVHPRRYNLRKGEAVRIYPSAWGDNFRLETDRLSGFIQVRRAE